MNDTTAAPGAAHARWRRSLPLVAGAALALTGCSDGAADRTNHLGFTDGVAPAEEGLSTLEAIALYGLAPLAIMLLIAALVWLPGMARGNRYRPARGWNAAPLWFGGPADPAAAVETAQTGDLVRGGASGSW